MTGSVWKNMDKPLLLVYLLLVAAGWFNIYSVVYDPESMAGFSLATRYGKQLVFIGFAVLLAAFVMIADVRIFTQFAYLYYGICILLLLAVLVIGTEISGAKSWIKVGPLSIQPSEFAKVATCLAFAKYVSQPALNMKRSRTQLQAALWFLIPMVLILLQPDAGSVLVFLAFLLPLYREGMSGWVLVTGLVAAVLFVAAALEERGFGCLAVCGMFVLYLGRRVCVQPAQSSSADPDQCAFGQGTGYSWRRLQCEPVQDSHRQRRLLGQRVPAGDADQVRFCAGTKHGFYFLYRRRGVGMGRVHGISGRVSFFAASDSEVGRAAEKCVCEGVRLRGGRDFLHAFFCQCGNDDRLVAGHRDSVAFLQLRRVFSMGFHFASIHFCQDGCQAAESVKPGNFLHRRHVWLWEDVKAWLRNEENAGKNCRRENTFLNLPNRWRNG